MATRLLSIFGPGRPIPTATRLLPSLMRWFGQIRPLSTLCYLSEGGRAIVSPHVPSSSGARLPRPLFRPPTTSYETALFLSTTRAIFEWHMPSPTIIPFSSMSNETYLRPHMTCYPPAVGFRPWRPIRTATRPLSSPMRRYSLFSIMHAIPQQHTPVPTLFPPSADSNEAVRLIFYHLLAVCHLAGGGMGDLLPIYAVNHLCPSLGSALV